MDEILGTTKFLWEVVKDGLKVGENKSVHVLPEGKTSRDFSGWEGPASVTEYFREVSFLFESTLAELSFTATWRYNGTYISNFNVVVDGSVAVLSSVTATVETDDALMQDGYAVLPYRINVLFSNVTGGNKRVVFRAEAWGNGGGRSIGTG